MVPNGLEVSTNQQEANLVAFLDFQFRDRVVNCSELPVATAFNSYLIRHSPLELVIDVKTCRRVETFIAATLCSRSYSR